MPYEQPAAAEASHESLFEFQSEVVERLLGGATADQVLDDVCELVQGRVPDAVCSIMVLDEERKSLIVKAAPCVPADVVSQLDGLVPGELAGACGTAVFTGRMVLVEDTTTDPRFADMQDFVTRSGVRSCWSIPVKAAGSILGTFAISRSVTGLPSPELTHLLSAAGGIVGLAIHRSFEERRGRSQDLMLRAVVEDTRDCIWVKDRGGYYVYANPAEAETAGRTLEDIIGHDDEALYPGENARLNRATDLEVLRTKASMTYVARFGSGDEARMYHVRKHPRFDQDGEVSEIIGVARDITDQERTQRALQQAQKLESLGLLAGGVAHDFNNLLVGVLGNAEWLLDRVNGDADVRASLEEIKKAATRAAALTKQFLAYAGRGSLLIEELDVRHLLREVLELVHGSLSAGVDTQVSFPERLPRVRGDGTQIQQVLMNLLVNACEALEGEAGVIEIKADETVVTSPSPVSVIEGDLNPGHYVRITVTDDGVGMNDATRARIFDPFYTTKANGRGLGLAAVLGILKAHGGGIGVTTAAGRGTEMQVYFPVQEALLPTTTAGDRPVALVVDDEALVRNVTRRLLESASYEVMTAASGREALRLVSEGDRDIDVIILDYNMPEMTGIETFHELEQIAPDTPVIMVTGGADGAILAETGAFVLAKPYTRATILEACETARERKHQS